MDVITELYQLKMICQDRKPSIWMLNGWELVKMFKFRILNSLIEQPTRIISKVSGGYLLIETCTIIYEIG